MKVAEGLHLPFLSSPPRLYLLATSMSNVSGVISYRTRPDQPLGPQDLHPRVSDLSPRGLDSLRLCDAVAWFEVAFGAVRATPVRGRCIAGPRPICVSGGARCDLGAPVHGGCIAGLCPGGVGGGGGTCFGGALRGGDGCLATATSAATASSQPCGARRPWGPARCGVSALDGVGGVMVVRPAATCLGNC
jgi:hypothetical protein